MRSLVITAFVAIGVGAAVVAMALWVVDRAGGEAQAKARPIDKELFSQGQGIFVRNCAACHQTNGEGVPGAFPPLAGNTNLKSTRLVVMTIHDGKTGPITVEGKPYNGNMPSFARFSAREIAAVATYVRNAWGNQLGGVSPAEVQEVLTTGKDPPQEEERSGG